MTFDTFCAPDGSYRYRLYHEGVLRCTSGGFLLLSDAERCAAKLVADPDTIHFL